MKNNTRMKLLVAVLLFITIAILPIIAKATNDNEVAVVDTEDNGYVIYIQNYISKEFKYAFSNSADAKEIELNYINSTIDNAGNQEAYLDKTTYNNMKNSNIYLYVKENENLILSGYELNFEDAILKSEIEKVENTTKTIAVDTTKTLVNSETVDGVIYTVTTGAVEIKDDANSKYKYQTVKLSASEDYNNLMELAKRINTEYEELDIYNQIVLAQKFNDLYERLLKNVQWQDVENMIVAQPEDADNGVQYILFLNKDDKTYDIQLLTSKKDYNQEYTKDTIVTTETSKLPITYDSIALIVILAVIVVAAVIVFVRMKKLSKSKEEK